LLHLGGEEQPIDQDDRDAGVGDRRNEIKSPASIIGTRRATLLASVGQRLLP